MPPKLLPSPSAQRPPERIPFDIKEWRKFPGKLVTRGELWEFVNRMETGRRVRNRWDRRLVRVARRAWNFLTRQTVDVEDQFYR